MGCGEPPKSERVRRTWLHGVRGGHPTRLDENCERIGGLDPPCLLAPNWRSTPRPGKPWVAAVQFSPYGQSIAAATWERESAQVYNTDEGRLPANTQYELAWAPTWPSPGSGTARNFLLRRTIERSTVLMWPPSRHLLHGPSTTTSPKCIALASNGTFIAEPAPAHQPHSGTLSRTRKLALSSAI